jgi:hypothetical protein
MRTSCRNKDILGLHGVSVTRNKPRPSNDGNAARTAAAHSANWAKLLFNVDLISTNFSEQNRATVGPITASNSAGPDTGVLPCPLRVIHSRWVS